MKKNIIFLIIAIIVGGGSFYGGMKYDQKNNSGKISTAGLQNMTAEQRQQSFQQFRGSGNNQGVRRNGTVGQSGGGGAFLNGEIISKDDKSVTIKLRDGGSKIVFLSDSTSIGKTTDGTAADLEAGKQVTINGKDNSDGSVTAQSIQVRPNLPPQ
jgi:hypothetical protein